ncbi:MAG TPA: FAD-binding oxidoreductase [Thermoanaerobaculia bacterium]|jgi:sarcosine oxidase subunit beta|nr:FAD-binding oxidoreductase [Thermoanaerobaculia bacterium]
MQSDIVILGAGIIGASVAYHLARRGCSVLVLDRAPDFGGGSTSKATGGFRTQFDNETEVRLSLRSREKLLAFPDEIGCDSGYRPHGYLFLACNDDELANLRNAQSVQHSCGVGDARMVSADEARALNPAIGDDTIIGGAFCPLDGFVRPMNILRGYADAAARLGVRFAFGVEHHGWRVDGDRVIAARTSIGDVQARLFVNAMGAFSGPPVVPLRRNIAATVATEILGESMPMTIWSSDWYHVRVRDGRVLLVWPDDPPYEHWLAWVLRLTHERMPCLIDVPVEDVWTGFYEMTPDQRALVGRSPQYENVYLATGCSGHGVMHSPAIGEVLSEMIVDGKTSIDITALRPERFAT